MTLDEIDKALAGWKTRLARIDENLIALETDSVYMLLEKAQESGLDGTTRARVAPALAAMRELFSQRGLLDDVLDRAATQRQGVNRLWPGDALKEIDFLLRGPSIALPPVETPLARRGLLDAAETTTAISPDQLVGAMVASFEQARDAVSAVSQAWDHLTPAIDKAAAEAHRLEAQATALDADVTAALSAVRAQIDAARAQIARDPLGASASIAADVGGRLTQLRAHLDELASRRAQVDTDLVRATAMLGGLRDTARDAAAAFARCEAEIAPAPGEAHRPAPIDEGRIEGLAQWLATLNATVVEGRWPAAGVGLTRWLAAAQETRDEIDAVERASSAPLDKRDELRGRLAARRQQARTLAARGTTLDPGLDAVADAATALLGRTPCPLADADAAVAAYEALLRGLRS